MISTIKGFNFESNDLTLVVKLYKNNRLIKQLYHTFSRNFASSLDFPCRVEDHNIISIPKSLEFGLIISQNINTAFIYLLIACSNMFDSHNSINDDELKKKCK